MQRRVSSARVGREEAAEITLLSGGRTRGALMEVRMMKVRMMKVRMMTGGFSSGKNISVFNNVVMKRSHRRESSRVKPQIVEKSCNILRKTFTM